MRHRHERGAATVEFALVLPLLLLLTFGILAFGYAFHVQTVLDNAARDAVRVAALTSGSQAPAEARAVARASASSAVTLSDEQIGVDLSACATPVPLASDRLAHVTIELEDFSLLGVFGPITLTGTGSMRCNG
ncbi:TadE/TadG family type IV pilus assembly protein [Agrococcus sp. ARC_14]|uniref:TadE/TadG family type IV pilus assembly protein n=1 Tax=Agrococcus sp. ARC_14 TaxID=2919927 RepID=UPI001F060CC6|nr:TadE/TadG family type IV pilus assembly protein [Agrococcus sp. ARC_14]MCH1883729.1 pilus assembly protein [Agrococcus sp. ARC_14]